MDGLLTVQVGTKQYLRYYYPGFLFSGDSVAEVKERDPKLAAMDAPEGAYAFLYYASTKVSVHLDDETILTTGDERDASPTYYIDAEMLTYDDVARLEGDHKILLDNMHGNAMAAVIRCRTGNFQEFVEGKTVLISST